MQDNKRLRSALIQFPVANRKKSRDKHLPILKKLEDIEETLIDSSNAIDTATLLAPQNKELTFSNSMKAKLHLGMNYSEDILGKSPVSSFSSTEEITMRKQQHNNVSKYLLVISEKNILHMRY